MRRFFYLFIPTMFWMVSGAALLIFGRHISNLGHHTGIHTIFSALALSIGFLIVAVTTSISLQGNSSLVEVSWLGYMRVIDFFRVAWSAISALPSAIRENWRGLNSLPIPEKPYDPFELTLDGPLGYNPGPQGA